MKEYSPELNFVFEFELSHNGMVRELKTEFDIIQTICGLYVNAKEEHRHMLDRILIMPLRKLMCEDGSILRKLCPDFKMPPLSGEEIVLDTDKKVHLLMVGLQMPSESTWIPVSDWLNQNIAWIVADETSYQTSFDDNTYACIRNKVKYKPTFDALFMDEEQLDSKGNIIKVKSLSDPKKGPELFSILKSIGYFDLTVYSFIKHISDKRGAHVDTDYSMIIESMNKSPYKNLSAIAILSMHMIMAAKKQIPELSLYCPNLDLCN